MWQSIDLSSGPYVSRLASKLVDYPARPARPSLCLSANKVDNKVFIYRDFKNSLEAFYC